VIGIFCDRRPSQTRPTQAHRLVSPAARFLACALCVLLTSKQPRRTVIPVPVHAVSTRYTTKRCSCDDAASSLVSPSHHRTTTVHRRPSPQRPRCLALPCPAFPHTSTSGRRNPRCSSLRPHSAHRLSTRPRLWRPAVPQLRKPSLAGPNLLYQIRAKPSSPNGTWPAGGSSSRGATRSRRTRQVRAHFLSWKTRSDIGQLRSTFVTVYPLTIHSNANSDTATAPGIFGIPLHTSIRYANVAISLFNDEGQSYIYGYVPIVVAKCGVFLKEKGK
jgi:hypothetical protein